MPPSIPADYTSVVPRMRGGDILVFDGGDHSDLVGLGQHFLANAIEAMTRSNLSHAAMVYGPGLPVNGQAQTELHLIESTILKGKSGPQLHPIAERLANYDGRAWWLPLSDRTRAMLDFPAMWQLAGEKLVRNHYNVRELFAYIGRKVPIFGWLPFLHHPDDDSEVCSELCAELLRAGGLPGLKPCEMPPQELAELKIYRDCVQLIGAPASIRAFNTV